MCDTRPVILVHIRFVWFADVRSTVRKARTERSVRVNAVVRTEELVTRRRASVLAPLAGL